MQEPSKPVVVDQLIPLQKGECIYYKIKKTNEPHGSLEVDPTINMVGYEPVARVEGCSLAMQQNSTSPTSGAGVFFLSTIKGSGSARRLCTVLKVSKLINAAGREPQDSSTRIACTKLMIFAPRSSSGCVPEWLDKDFKPLPEFKVYVTSERGGVIRGILDLLSLTQLDDQVKLLIEYLVSTQCMQL